MTEKGRKEKLQEVDLNAVDAAGGYYTYNSCGQARWVEPRRSYSYSSCSTPRYSSCSSSYSYRAPVSYDYSYGFYNGGCI